MILAILKRPNSFRFAKHCSKYIPRAKKTAEVVSVSEDEEDVPVRSNTVKAMTIKSKKTDASPLYENHDDCSQTPVCSMTIQTRGTRGHKGHEFNHTVLPDTGCSQSIIALNFAKDHGMEINLKKRKRILNASDELMHCNGTVIFNVN